MKKYEFENLGLSAILALSAISGPSVFHCMEKDQWLSTEFSKTKWKPSNWDLEGKNQASCFGKKPVPKPNWEKYTSNSGSSHHSESQCKNGIDKHLT